MKEMGPNGLLLDSSFTAHVALCSQCHAVVLPAGVATLCLEGVILWKRENTVVIAPDIEVDPNITSRAKAKSLMRYK